MDQSGSCSCNPCDFLNLPNNPINVDTTFVACDSIHSEMIMEDRINKKTDYPEKVKGWYF